MVVAHEHPASRALVLRTRRFTDLAEPTDAHTSRDELQMLELAGGKLTVIPFVQGCVQRLRLIYAIAVVFAAVAALEVALGVTYNLVFVAVAVPFAAASYMMWYHASGRLARNVQRQAARRSRTRARTRTQQRTRVRSAGNATNATAAYRILDVEPDASQREVKRAYREKVKEVHPDAERGSERAFKQVTEAYESLQEIH